MKLYEFNPKYLNYDDSGEFIVRYITDVQNQNIDLDLDFKGMHDSIVAQSPVFNAALAKIKARAESKQLLILDHIRDRKIITLRAQFRVSKNADEPDVKEAYGIIKVVFDAYKGLESRNYPSETLGINSLIVELTNATNQPLSHLLKLDNHIANLETANNNFVAKFDARSTNVISTENYDTKLLRKNILDKYVDLVDYVRVMAKTKNNPYYDSLVNTINYSRQYYATILAGYDSNPPAAPTAK